ncbi:MAG: ornithine carbamoyltransferase [Deltaproteobacteria bacterium]|jgi:ornithine carbamoyltransferase|nr:ornithine carbamoyltransferase [Deltaproteobacteria bacterium]
MNPIGNFLSVYDFTADEIYNILLRSAVLKKERRSKNVCLEGKKIGLIFEKSSTRTRVSFEVGIVELGGHPVFMSSRDLQLGRGEPVKDTARVLSRYLDGVIIRTFGQERIETFARYFEKPVVNGLTDLYHPAQILTDIFTVYEIKRESLDKPKNAVADMNVIKNIIKNLKIVYFGDANNMANSWVSLQAMLGFELVLAMPDGFDIDKNVRVESEKRGGRFLISGDKISAAKDADVITTDVFISMGQDEEKEKIDKLKPFIIDDNVVKNAKDDVIFLHCLPVHRNEEVTEDVFERFSPVVFEEAENRLHVQKAIMEKIF